MNSKMQLVRRWVLFAAAAVLLFVSLSILLTPEWFYAYNGIQAAGNANLLNELKAPAGLLLVAGVFGLHAALTGQRIMQALSLAALIYATYALTRLFSMLADGLPVSALVQAAVAEGVLALACIALLTNPFVRRKEV